MKYTEKMQLLLKGVKMDEIKALEEQEALELEEAGKAPEEDEENKSYLELLNAANTLVKELETKLEAKDAELKELNKDLESINNKKTLTEQPTTPDASDVFTELFKPSKEV